MTSTIKKRVYEVSQKTLTAHTQPFAKFRGKLKCTLYSKALTNDRSMIYVPTQVGTHVSFKIVSTRSTQRQ